MMDITGYSLVPLMYACEENEQDLYLPALIDARARNTVTQQHLRATTRNIQLLNEFRVRPVVLVRNLFDIVISLRDHIHRESGKCSMFFPGESFAGLSEQEQFDTIIDMALPWYVSFFVSWTEAARRGDIPVFWLNYREMMQDKEAVLAQILGFYGLDRYRQAIGKALARAGTGSDTRLNVGVSGRGRATLSDAQVDRIYRQVSHYPGIDFSAVLN